jgi:tetratricopeptide (TPR) repeat protein
LRPDNARVCTALGRTLLETGALDEGLGYCRRALVMQPDYYTAHRNVGVALTRQGKLEEAIAVYRQALPLFPENYELPAFLAYELTKLGELPEAIAAYRKALALRPDLHLTQENLGVCYLRQRAWPEAIAAFRGHVALRPKDGQGYFRLGEALLNNGEFDEGLVCLRKAHALQVKPSGAPTAALQALRQGERLVKLEGQLAAVLAGQVEPGSAAELASYAELCRCKRRHAAAARLYQRAFMLAPGFADGPRNEGGYRLEAAAAAALAAAARGEDAAGLDAAERSRWRRQALAWLNEQLHRYQTAFTQSKTPEDRLRVHRELRYILYNVDLEELRSAAVLAGLPEEESAACRRFWAEVNELLRQQPR